MAGTTAEAAAFRLAWSGADPGVTDHAARPPEAPVLERPVPLARDGTGVGALLALSLAADPDRVVGGVRLRRVPSAGGRYPVDARVGGRIYDPVRHAVDGGPVADVADIELSLDPARTRWRYGPRTLPLLLLDLGHAAAAVLAAATALGTPRRARLHPDGADSRVLLVRDPHPSRGTGPDGAGPARTASVLRDRRSTPLHELGPPEPGAGADGWPELLACARARLTPGQHAAVLGAGHPVLPALSERACGRPDLTGPAGLLVVTGDLDPGPDTVPQHVRAGIAVHDAWLAATAAGVPARPVGCWVEAVLRGPGGRGRIQHAMALGPRGPAPDR